MGHKIHVEWIDDRNRMKHPIGCTVLINRLGGINTIYNKFVIKIPFHFLDLLKSLSTYFPFTSQWLSGNPANQEFLLEVTVDHLLNNLFSFHLPFISIGCRIVKTLITGDSKDVAFFQFFGQWNHVVIKKPVQRKQERKEGNT